MTLSRGASHSFSKMCVPLISIIRTLLSDYLIENREARLVVVLLQVKREDPRRDEHRRVASVAQLLRQHAVVVHHELPDRHEAPAQDVCAVLRVHAEPELLDERLEDVDLRRQREEGLGEREDRDDFAEALAVAADRLLPLAEALQDVDEPLARRLAAQSKTTTRPP